MSAALIDLVSKGAQDVYITGQPQVSFFRQNYKRHTTFAMKPSLVLSGRLMILPYQFALRVIFLATSGLRTPSFLMLLPTLTASSPRVLPTPPLSSYGLVVRRLPSLILSSFRVLIILFYVTTPLNLRALSLLILPRKTTVKTIS